MSLFNIFNVSGSAMSAQAQRLNTVASNLANADSATSASGEAYRAKQVVFEAVPMANGATAVKVQKVIEDDWFAQRGYRVLELPTGQGLLVK